MDNRRKIYRVAVHGDSDVTQVNNEESYYINIIGDWIYYSSGTDTNQYGYNYVHMVKTNSTE
ncbi:MAG: hypothetical protein A2Y21_03205 [Clostridiales bacterium GWC2_40_7]|nr:MAG: hypothetical protein A2Y21_03205 [Clostridiales bacterium GWC2_40_7]